MLLFFLIAILSWLMQLFMPWWIMPVIAFVVASFLARSGGHAFISGSLGCAISWLLPAVFISFTRGTLMTERIAELFALPASWMLYVITFMVAGIMGGLASLSGFYLQRLRSAG